MAGKSIDIGQIFDDDDMGRQLANRYMEWEQFRQKANSSWSEVTSYVYATDTLHTTAEKVDWKNTTTIPKLCQIRDNLHANYMSALFPKRDWLDWEGTNEADDDPKKAKAILGYMKHVTQHGGFRKVVSKLIYDYIDYGNCFAIPVWENKSRPAIDDLHDGYIGPLAKRVSPYNLCFNPIADRFEDSPKFLRSLVTIGGLKAEMEKAGAQADEAEAIFAYVQGVRERAGAHGVSALREFDKAFQIAGFDSFRAYLDSDYVEVLTFYGDVYDKVNEEILTNHKIVIVDRHKVVVKEAYKGVLDHLPIYHSGWRIRQDNLWAMGPLDNLVGMQYRVDHLENLKADVFDLIAFPPLKVRGYVENFKWGPMEQINVGDDGDVEMIAPNHNVLNTNLEIEQLEKKMEEMAGAPKEAMGQRSPGEKTMFEVQQLQNAASRIFQAKIQQFEAEIIEPLLNGMLALAIEHMDTTSVKMMDEEFGVGTFESITVDDLNGVGRLRPVAARHFAEKSQIMTDLTNFFNTPVGQDPAVTMHLSGEKLAEMFGEIIGIDKYKIVEPYIRISEQAEAQERQQAMQEEQEMKQGQPAGMSPEDSVDGPITPEEVAEGDPDAEDVDPASQGPAGAGEPGPGGPT